MSTLRRLREQRHLTQEQLAVAAEVSTSTVYHAESGRVRPRTAILRRIARALEVDPGEIEIRSSEDASVLGPSASTHTDADRHSDVL